MNILDIKKKVAEQDILITKLRKNLDMLIIEFNKYKDETDTTLADHEARLTDGNPSV